MTFTLFMHHIVFVLYPFCANLQSTLGFVCFSFLLYVLVLILAPCLGKLELIGFLLLHLCLPLGVMFLRMTVIKMHIPKAKLPFYPPCEVKCKLKNGLSTLFVLTCSLPLVLCFFFLFVVFWSLF